MAFLNDDSVRFLMWVGNEFHREGVATENALSPQVRCLVLGICRGWWSADLRHRDGGVLVEEVREVGGSQVVEGRVGGE